MKKFIFIFLIIFTTFLLAAPALAQDDKASYNLMTNIPGAGKIENINQYIKALYLFGLAIVGIIAMLFIIIGGIRYMTAAGNETAISDAKSQITAAILGLVLVLTSWLILNTINPELVALRNLTPEPVNVAPPIEIGTWKCVIADEYGNDIPLGQCGSLETCRNYQGLGCGTLLGICVDCSTSGTCDCD